MTTATIDNAPAGGYSLRTPYDTGLLAAFKAAVPAADRTWDSANRRWLFDPAHVNTVIALCEKYGYSVTCHARPAAATPVAETRLLRVEYIGAPKERKDGRILAYGYVDGGWNVLFPEAALRAWFAGGLDDLGGQGAATAATTYYGLLGVKRTATDAEIKSAHRLMVKRWHPDVNRDPDAGEMMKRINGAYAILANATLRRRYDFGLTLENDAAQQGQRPPATTSSIWRPPLRCGWILVEGVAHAGRIAVQRILQWQDITDAAGRVMVTSWPTGATTFKTEWI